MGVQEKEQVVSTSPDDVESRPEITPDERRAHRDLVRLSVRLSHSWTEPDHASSSNHPVEKRTTYTYGQGIQKSAASCSNEIELSETKAVQQRRHSDKSLFDGKASDEREKRLSARSSKRKKKPHHSTFKRGKETADFEEVEEEDDRARSASIAPNYEDIY